MCLLTVCIPTYDRLEWVEETVSELNAVADYDFEIVIVTEPTSDERKNNQYWSEYDVKVRIFENETRLGFPKSILKLVNVAEGDFVLFSSDEDFLESDQIPWLLSTIENNNEVTRIIGSVNMDAEEGKYNSKEGLTEFFWSEYHLTGHLIKKEATDTSYAKQYASEQENALGAYIHQVLATQAMTAGVTLYTDRDFWRYGPEQISEHEVNYATPEARARQCSERVSRIIPDLIQDPSLERYLLKEEQKYAAKRLLLSVFSPRSGPTFRPHSALTVFRIIINNRKISHSVVFWYSLPIKIGDYIIRKSKSKLM
jgi:glycosyltransferase involved in cell wall biosynthesis